MKILIALSCLLYPVWSMAQNPFMPTVHVLRDYQIDQIIELGENENAADILVGMHPSRSKRFSIILHDSDQALLIEVKDVQEKTEGRIYHHVELQYGMDFHFGKTFQNNAMVIDDPRTHNLDINYNQEFIVYRLNLKRMTIAPAFHQNVHFFSTKLFTAPKVGGILAEPASFGMFVHHRGERGQTFNAGVTYGPGISVLKNPVLPHYSLVGYANLRLSIVF